MSSYEEALAAIDAIDGEFATTDDQIQALRDLVDLFKPYEGDNPIEAQSREIINARCGNCGFINAAFSTPSDLGRCGNSLLRRAVCPRCYSTDLFLDGETA